MAQNETKTLKGFVRLTDEFSKVSQTAQEEGYDQNIRQQISSMEQQLNQLSASIRTSTPTQHK